MTQQEKLMEVLASVGDTLTAVAQQVAGMDDKSSVAKATVADAAQAEPAAPVSTAKPRTNRHGTVYGTAPMLKDENGLHDHKATHVARVAALEKAIPGIGKIAFFQAVGVKAGAVGKDNKTKVFSAMEPQRGVYTWVELPGGKNQTVGTMSPREVFEALKMHGYGYSKGNTCWMTDARGCPPNRFAGKCQGVGRAMINDE